MISKPMHVYRLGYGGYESGGRSVLLSERCWSQEEFVALFDLALAQAAREDWETHEGYRREFDPGDWRPTYSGLHDRVVELMCAEHGFALADEHCQAAHGLFGDAVLNWEGPSEGWGKGPELDRAMRVVCDAVPEGVLQSEA